MEQITAILKQAELGAPIAELCRQHGISEQSSIVLTVLSRGLTPREYGPDINTGSRH